MSEGIDLASGLGFLLRLKFRIFDKILFSRVRAMLGGRFRFTFSAAGALSADLCKTFMAMGIRIFGGYGATETWNTLNLNRPGKILPGSVGPVTPGVEGRIADDRKFVTALVVPKFEFIIQYFDQKGIPYDRAQLEYSEAMGQRLCVKVGGDFIGRPELKELVDGEIRQANSRLEEYERIKKYIIIGRKFTEQTGEITPTLMMRRKVVQANYMKEIDALYE